MAHQDNDTTSENESNLIYLPLVVVIVFILGVMCWSEQFLKALLDLFTSFASLLGCAWRFAVHLLTA